MAVNLETLTAMAFTVTPEYIRDIFKDRYENPDYPKPSQKLKPGAVLVRDENGQEHSRYTVADYFRDNPTA